MAVGGAIAQAAVELVADGSKLPGDVRKALDQAGRTAQKSGAASGSRFTAAFGKSMSTLGGVAGRAFAPVTAQLANFSAGFRSSDAAASAFTGTMGRLGGAARTALEPAISGAQNFVAGFRSSQAAASAFTGKLGTLGGIASKALNGVSSAFGSVKNVASNAFSGIRGVISKMASGGASEIEGKLSSAFGRIKSIGVAALTAVGVGGAGAMVSAGINRISQIEQATKSLEVMMGSAKKAKGFMDELLGFAKTTPFAFPELATAAKNMVAFGVDAKKVVPTLKAIGDAAAASGRGTQAMTEISDIFGQIQIAGKVTTNDLQMLQQRGVDAFRILANKAGVSVTEMQKRVSSGSIDSKTAFDYLVDGIENGTDGIAGHTAKLGGVMDGLKDTWMGSLDSLKSAVSSTMADLLTPVMPSLRAGMAAFGNEFKKLPQFVADVKAKFQSSGLADAFGTFFRGLGTLIQGILPGVKAFGTYFVSSLGAALLALRPLGTALQAVGGWMQRNEGFVRLLGAALGTAAAAVVAYRVATTAAAIATRLFTIAMNANPIMLIVTAIGALVGAFVYLWNNSAGFRQFWIGLWQQILQVAQPVIAWFQSTVVPFFSSLWQQIQNLGSQFAAWWSGLWNSQIGAVIRTVLAAIWSNVQFVWNAIVSVISGAVQAIWGVIQGVFTAISGIIQGALSIIQGIIQVFTGILTGNWSKAWEGIKNILSGVWSIITGIVGGAIQAVKGVISGALSAISGIWNSAWSSLSNFVNNAWSGITGGVRRGIDAVIGFLRELPSKIISFFSNAGSWLLDAGKAIINGLLDGIKKAVGAVWNFVSGIGKKIADLKGPLPYDRVLLIPHGKAIMGGLDKGIRSEWASVRGTLRSITREIPDVTMPISVTGGIGRHTPETAAAARTAQAMTSYSQTTRSADRQVTVHAPITLTTAARDPRIAAAHVHQRIAALAQA